MKNLSSHAVIFLSTALASVSAFAGDVIGTPNMPGPGAIGLVAVGIVGAIAVARKRK